MRALDPLLRRDADPTLAVLHGLRLKGFVDTATLLGQLALDPAVVHGAVLDGAVPVGAVRDGEAMERELACLVAAGAVRCSTGLDATGRRVPRWSLTPAGRAEHERLLAEQLDATEQRPAVEEAYRDFLELNQRLLATCTRWQVRDLDAGTLNDHSDLDYDAAVIDTLLAIDAEAQPLLARLTAVLARFARYSAAFGVAIAELGGGNTEWFADPLLASYHTVWFELHEDLLATLGLQRETPAAEPAAT